MVEVPGELLQSLCHQSPRIDVLRLDRLHGLASGNKWFKLRANLDEARRVGARHLVSFGGAYSNHLHALAAIAAEQAWPCCVFVRADSDQQTPCMVDMARWGTRIVRLSRADYRQRREPAFVDSLLCDIDRPYLIPEGGANVLGAAGCMDIAALLPRRGADYDALILACGTGSTLAGLAAGVADGVQIIGVPVVKKAEQFMPADIERLLGGLDARRVNWSLDYRFIGKGFGRVTPTLAAFMARFEQQTGIPLDPVYTGKLFYAVEALKQAREFNRWSRVLVVHTGGLQGRRGYPALFTFPVDEANRPVPQSSVQAAR